jgi:hypothetical protein
MYQYNRFFHREFSSARHNRHYHLNFAGQEGLGIEDVTSEESCCLLHVFAGRIVRLPPDAQSGSYDQGLFSSLILT